MESRQVKWDYKRGKRIQNRTNQIQGRRQTLMKKSYVSVLISVVKLELAAQNILKMMDTG